MKGQNNNFILKIARRIIRNQRTLNQNKIKVHRVNVEWWNDTQNVGDQLSPVVVQWILEQKGINPDETCKKTVHLLAIGSIIGIKDFDAVIWGSGIHALETVMATFRKRKYVKYDIRAVRGPITKAILESCGYNCSNCVLGDPAVLMPLIYKGNVTEKKYSYSVINHISNMDEVDEKEGIHYINVATDDYKGFINEILQSERIISSSLHGIILAESYGVPTIFLNSGMDEQIMKYYDWYWSTGRRNVISASSIEEALEMLPMELPDIRELQNNLIEHFPYDLW